MQTTGQSGNSVATPVKGQSTKTLSSFFLYHFACKRYGLGNQIFLLKGIQFKSGSDWFRTKHYQMLYGLVKRSFHLNKNYFTFIKISGKFTLELEGRGLFWKSSVMEKLLEWNIWEGGEARIHHIININTCILEILTVKCFFYFSKLLAESSNHSEEN